MAVVFCSESLVNLKATELRHIPDDGCLITELVFKCRQVKGMSAECHASGAFVLLTVPRLKVD